MNNKWVLSCSRGQVVKPNKLSPIASSSNKIMMTYRVRRIPDIMGMVCGMLSHIAFQVFGIFNNLADKRG